MGEQSKIEWTTHTFNAWIGCTKVSAACTHCYAEKETFTRVMRGRGIELWGPKAERHVTSGDNWKKPLRWNRLAAAAGERHRVFCSSLSDVFERREGAIGARLDAARTRLWDLIERTPNLDWLLLTKRPENVMSMVPASWRGGFPPSVWLGTTCEDQERADERCSELLQCPAAVLFISAEPLLGPIDLFAFLKGPLRDKCLGILGSTHARGIDWVIVGGESGPGARPFNVAWARSIVEQCKAAGVACFVKQFGRMPYEDGLAERPGVFELKDRKGGDWSEWPIDLRVREFPSNGAAA